MNNAPMRVGSATMQCTPRHVSGEFVSLAAERFYRIANYDRMTPFFMSIVSASNHWMFISSLGGLTAGRQNADNALFPYYTEDKIHDGSTHTGSRTIVRVLLNEERFVWEPFSTCFGGGRSLYAITRNLYKNVPGNKLLFEEINEDLGLTFRYCWQFSDRFGFVKHSEIENTGSAATRVEILDGIENLLPTFITEAFQNTYSCLGDAYKQNECDGASGIATYAFSSRPGDNPEPSEALRATVCWSNAASDDPRLLSSLQLDNFRFGARPEPESRICGRRGAYFVSTAAELTPSDSADWLIVADLDYGLPEIAALKETFASTATPEALKARVLDDVDDGTARLKSIVARADGLQVTGDEAGAAHHFANVLFNVMRGGVFESGYAIPVADFSSHVRAFNREVSARHQEFLQKLGESIDLGALMQQVRDREDPDLERLTAEYLPISFSRRHGDPSRPWNKFSINVKQRDGSRLLDYQGNWRDIFQNWEALCFSFPEYVESIIAKFLNSSTADGYNPYRVTRQGYEWEAPDPDDPWAHFGYWGDHQIIYLLKLLELSRRHHPEALARWLGEDLFVYADMPYFIKPYEQLLHDPRNAIDYSAARAGEIEARVEKLGFDGRYLPGVSGVLHRANLAEKLLLPLLTKLGNFVPGAGFWMNTQRPEWNDANNALAGYGASVVTLCYARRYVAFLIDFLSSSGLEHLTLGRGVATWLAATAGALRDAQDTLAGDRIDDAVRKRVVDDLAGAASAYRAALYSAGPAAEKETLPTRDILDLLRVTQQHFDHTIALNRRDDGLYHAYNVLDFSDQGIHVERLQVMLEGQVAALSSGALDAKAALEVLKALRNSDLYREDQHSYLLYPNRRLRGFLDKNTIPEDQVARSALIRRLLEDGDTTLVERDVDGAVHFSGVFKNVRDVRAALQDLKGRYGDLAASEGAAMEAVFESVFDHRTFTGRSGTFYGYEGLGCIYWHMVSKLLLATQEMALREEVEPGLFDAITAAYYEVRAGIGFNKSPQVYGAFPTDPYSHTPGHSGAKQPGMTGQVKEEIITRLGELGVTVTDGRLAFTPRILDDGEFLPEPVDFEYYDARGELQTLSLRAGMLAFTYCQVPVIYRRGSEPSILLRYANGETVSVVGNALDAEASCNIFQRRGDIRSLEVVVPAGRVA
jgi:hypothetical protein